MKNALKAAIGLLCVFIILAIVRANYEFLFYASTLIVLLYVLTVADKKYDFSQFGLWGFNIWLLSHLLGGLASIQGTRLYDYMLIPIVGEPFFIFKYDQAIHMLTYFIMTILVYDVMRKVVSKTVATSTVFVLTFLAATGIGGLNELIEYLAFVFLGSTGVGDYYNTGLDFIANAIGSGVSLVYIKYKHMRKEK